MEEQRDQGGGEEFGVGSALVGGEEHVGVHCVEDRSEQCSGGRWRSRAQGSTGRGRWR